MIVLTMTINSHTEVINISAMRVHPTHRTPKRGELCDHLVKSMVENSPIQSAVSTGQR